MEVTFKMYSKTDTFGIYFYKDEACTIRHRENGAAIEYHDGDKEWYFNGKRHREDGPAIEKSDGTKIWFLNGEEILRINGGCSQNYTDTTIKVVAEKLKEPTYSAEWK